MIVAVELEWGEEGVDTEDKAALQRDLESRMVERASSRRASQDGVSQCRRGEASTRTGGGVCGARAHPPDECQPDGGTLTWGIRMSTVRRAPSQMGAPGWRIRA